MKIRENESLSKYTTFQMGGIAKKLYFPENLEEVTSLMANQKTIHKYIIGGGSNLLINDQRTFEAVICLKDFHQTIEKLGDGRYYAGASVRLQELIKTINEDDYGGIEYLFSVPGLVGGATCMNAGRGKAHHQCISDYIESVDVLVDGEMKNFSKEDCGFAYRTSKFRALPGCIICGVYFRFPSVPKEEARGRIQERIDLCRRVQDMSAPNFGTVFCESNKYIMTLVKKLRLGYQNGCAFSGKTSNWMLRGKEGTFEQAMKLLNKVQKWHRMFGRNCRTEVEIWE